MPASRQARVTPTRPPSIKPLPAFDAAAEVSITPEPVDTPSSRSSPEMLIGMVTDGETCKALMPLSP